MITVILFSLFEAGLFPDNFLAEKQFNPACVRDRSSEIYFCAGSRFGMSELREYRLHFHARVYSVGLHSMGSALYRENCLYGSFGVLINDFLSAGLRLDVLNCWITGERNLFSYSLRAGCGAELGLLTLGMWVNNFNQPRFTPADRLPVTYSLCADYILEQNITLFFAVRSIAGALPFYNTGIRLMMFKFAECGLGLNTDPVLVEYSGCFSMGRLNLTYQGSSHPDLGRSHSLGLCFRL